MLDGQVATSSHAQDLADDIRTRSGRSFAYFFRAVLGLSKAPLRRNGLCDFDTAFQEGSPILLVVPRSALGLIAGSLRLWLHRVCVTDPRRSRVLPEYHSEAQSGHLACSTYSMIPWLFPERPASRSRAPLRRIYVRTAPFSAEARPPQMKTLTTLDLRRKT
jgi:hypothetical protein